MPDDSLAAPEPQRNTRFFFVCAIVLLISCGAIAYRLIPNPSLRRSGDLWQVDLRALGDFYFDESNGTIQDVPQKWRNIDGQRIEVHGFPCVTSYAGDLIPEFQFVSSFRSEHRGPPHVQERIFAHSTKMKDGMPNYEMQYCKLVGTFHIQPKVIEGKVVCLFTMDVESITLVE